MKKLIFAPIIALVVSVVCTILYPSITSVTAVGICALLTAACLAKMKKSR